MSDPKSDPSAFEPTVVGPPDSGEASSSGSTFLDRARNEGVLPDDEPIPVDAAGLDATSLAERLVGEGRITRYQADQLLGLDTDVLVIDDYVVAERIGGGGMGTVYRARHRLMGREVAVKVLRGGGPGSVDRFRREMRITSALEHENVVRALDAGVQGDRAFLVMELLDGRDLDRVIRDAGAVPVRTALDYVRQAARGLGYAHGKGVVHRDVKPSNLVLTADGTLKVVDLGLAKFLLEESASADSGSDISLSGQVFGTVAYMAPEQAADSRAVDERADVYGLGCTLHRLLTRMPPYPSEDRLEGMLLHRTGDIPALAHVAGVTPTVDALFQRMVAKDPGDRFASMDELVAAIDEAIDSLGDEAFDGSHVHEGSTRLGPGGSSADMPTTDFPSERADPTRRPLAVIVPVVLAVVAVLALAIARPWEGEPEVGGGDPGATNGHTGVHDGHTAVVNRDPRHDGHDGGHTADKLPTPAPLPDTVPVAEEQAATAERLGIPVGFVNELGMEFVLIPAQPPFYAGVHEVTQDQYARVTGERPSAFSVGGRERRALAAAGIEETGNLPVESLLRDRAAAFCDRLAELPAERTQRRRYRLPTVEEWRTAARGGDVGNNFWGEDENATRYGWCEPNSGLRTHPVGELAPNGYGLRDVVGNVAEWTSDTNKVFAVACGGSVYEHAFHQTLDRIVEAAMTGKGDPGIGFRVVLDVPAGE